MIWHAGCVRQQQFDVALIQLFLCFCRSIKSYFTDTYNYGILCFLHVLDVQCTFERTLFIRGIYTTFLEPHTPVSSFDELLRKIK